MLSELEHGKGLKSPGAVPHAERNAAWISHQGSLAKIHGGIQVTRWNQGMIGGGGRRVGGQSHAPTDALGEEIPQQNSAQSDKIFSLLKPFSAFFLTSQFPFEIRLWRIRFVFKYSCILILAVECEGNKQRLFVIYMS